MFLCAQEPTLESAFISRLQVTRIRVALTVVLLACSCAADLRTSHHVEAVQQIRQCRISSQFSVHGVRPQLSTCIASTGALQRLDEQKRKGESNSFSRTVVRRDDRISTADNRAFLIIAPDRLIELSDTPPPALHSV
jgi:hypothetical protein